MTLCVLQVLPVVNTPGENLKMGDETCEGVQCVCFYLGMLNWNVLLECMRYVCVS